MIMLLFSFQLINIIKKIEMKTLGKVRYILYNYNLEIIYC